MYCSHTIAYEFQTPDRKRRTTQRFIDLSSRVRSSNAPRDIIKLFASRFFFLYTQFHSIYIILRCTRRLLYADSRWSSGGRIIDTSSVAACCRLFCQSISHRSFFFTPTVSPHPILVIRVIYDSRSTCACIILCVYACYNKEPWKPTVTIFFCSYRLPTEL